MNLNSCPPHPLGKKKPGGTHQTLLTMRLILLLTIITCFKVTAAVYAQQINLNVKEQPIEKVFDEIKKQSGYQFIYNDRLLEHTSKITLTLKNANLQTALNECFKGQPVSYEIVGNSIVVKVAKPTLIPKIKTAIQNQLINGRVTDSTGLPLPGVTIRAKNNSASTVTNASGEFVISVPEKSILIISFIGFETIELPAENKGLLRVIMHQSSSKLDEVQVIAYGSTTRRLSTGDVSTVKAVDIEKQPVSNPLAALQGRVPGLVITQTSGVSGSAFKVQLRGQSSLDPTLSQNDPLFVIDGVPFESGNAVTNQIVSAANNPVSASNGGLSPLNTINPQDIESIDVLKDADATAIYGSRGANGVILITTKKGKAGKTTVNINLNSGVSRIGRSMDMLNTQQYVQIRKEAFANDGLSPSANSSDPGYAPDITLWDTTRYTDFKKLLIGNTAQYNNMQASVSGGNNFTQFRFGTNYHRETTVYAGSFSDQISSVNFSLTNHSADGKFSLQFSGIYSSDYNQLPSYDLTKYINLPPNLLLYNNQGGLAWDEKGIAYNSLNLTNPLSLLNEHYFSTNENLAANLNLNYQIIPGLALKTNLGFNTFNVNEKTTIPSTAIDPNNASYIFPSSEFATSNNKNWIIEPQIEYQHSYSFGKLEALAGYTFQNKSGRSNDINGQNYNSDLLLNSIAAAGSVTATNNAVTYRYTAFFGRVNYNIDDKYILNLTGRRDGSSRFGPDRQWADFGAAGLAWVFTSESFIKDRIPFLSFGKLRVSYGTTGNDQIGDYKFLNLWNNTSNTYNGTPGLAPISLYNPDYNWEVNKKLEASLDMGLFKDRLLINATYYRNRSSNQLIRYVLPTQTGFSSVIMNFPGLVQNSGFEFSVNSKNIANKSFSWTTAFNISIPKNKLISFPGLSTSNYKDKYVEGQSLSIIRGLKYLGVDPQTGLYTFADLNKDGQIYDGDYEYFGNTDPKYYGGLQNNFSYKNFELSFFLQFTKQIGANYISQLASFTPGSIINQPTLVLGRWKAPGDQAQIQKLTASFDGPASTGYGDLSVSDGAYTDASYIKLKNLSLSYKLPTTWMQKLNVSSCRVYIEMQNVFTLTHYKGADPETQNFYALPPLRTIVAGLQLNL
jgi:TonB-linked SusC/RagA family outer membrane protein